MELIDAGIEIAGEVVGERELAERQALTMLASSHKSLTKFSCGPWVPASTTVSHYGLSKKNTHNLAVSKKGLIN